MLSWLQQLHPLLAPFCFTAAWGLVVLTSWSLWSMGRDGMVAVKKMHQIPCAHCQFFSGDYRLKCALHPYRAATEEAINCADFRSGL
ncbi:hypothetical protein L3556_08305 [Candidatus Synechococcus calcipolaris G9]|uniref:Secreted protein n=1 Tax=Candidatus Synechococcus calcipolaris G9 TaxID=1497997 RepID=A0ABT6EZB0_9SYNE|nr:hypothetical protein [Candidatus Synechococcus calcipolaris]MDG2990928.1 hypothetical protein [Candidatus Synechococcus calcipolaris G9]